MSKTRNEGGASDRQFVASGELLNLQGMTNHVHVAAGGVARIQGKVTEEVEVERGGVAIVQGKVTNISGDGYVWVSGMVTGAISPSVAAEFHPNAPNPESHPTTIAPSFGWPEGEPPPEVVTINP
jgi:hypothetical protein